MGNFTGKHTQCHLEYRLKGLTRAQKLKLIEAYASFEEAARVR